MAQIDDKQYGICLDPLTGKLLWKSLLLPKPNTHFQGGPVASPVVDGDRVFFIPYDNEKNPFKPHCPVVCVKNDGTELWRENDNVWATEGSTPLVIGNVLYVASSHADTLLMAVDKMTGRRLWAAKCPMLGPFKDQDPFAAAASLTYQTVAGIPQIISAVYYAARGRVCPGTSSKTTVV
jgi:outer membrane protein assembly factor BamB